ncbi:MAG: PEP-CTERM sorting domain-containing protein [Verrucomicrobiales bacterium]
MNWSTDLVPVSPDDAVFINPAAGPAAITANTAPVRDVRFGSDGRTGSGTVNHSAGTAQVDGWVRMGINSGSSGTYNLSGTGNLNINGRFYIAEQAGTTGNFVQSGGTTTINAGGGNAGLYVGNDGAGTFTMSSGTFTQAAAADPNNGDSWNRVAANGGSTGVFNLSGGTMSLDARTFLGANGTATLTQTGGVLEVRRGEVNIADAGTSTYNISAGTLRTLNAGSRLSVGQWDNGNGTLNVSGTGDVNIAGDLVVAAGRDGFPTTGLVAQSGGVVTVGDELILGESTTANGTYNLSGGTLNMTGGTIRRGVGTGTFNFTGGRLEDASVVQFALAQQGGVLAPGPSGGSGITTINGDYNMSSGGTLEISLLNPGAADQLAVNGLTNLAGILDLVPAEALALGSTFTILSNDATDPINGGFLNRPDDSTFTEDGNTFTINYQGGTDLNDVVLTVVPEPGSSLLLLSALGLGALRYRRRPV